MVYNIICLNLKINREFFFFFLLGSILLTKNIVVKDYLVRHVDLSIRSL
ncbi:unnamed protein product [Musa hybrid cultivar]